MRAPPSLEAKSVLARAEPGAWLGWASGGWSVVRGLRGLERPQGPLGAGASTGAGAGRHVFSLLVHTGSSLPLGRPLLLSQQGSLALTLHSAVSGASIASSCLASYSTWFFCALFEAPSAFLEVRRAPEMQWLHGLGLDPEGSAPSKADLWCHWLSAEVHLGGGWSPLRSGGASRSSDMNCLVMGLPGAQVRW